MKTTAIIRYRGASYRAQLDVNDDVQIEKRRGDAAWELLAVGMFQHGLLDCGDEGARVPEAVWERLHDALETLINDERDEDGEIDDIE